MASRIVLGIIIIALLGGDRVFRDELQNRIALRERQVGLHEDYSSRQFRRAGDARPGCAARRQPSAAAPTGSTFRIATYNLGGLDENKLSNPRIADILSRTVARDSNSSPCKGLRGKNQGVPVRLVDQLNAPKRSAIRIRHLPHAAARRHRALLGILLRQSGFGNRSSRRCVSSRIRCGDSATSRWSDRSARAGRSPPRRSPSPWSRSIPIPEKPAAELDLLADVFRAVRDDGAEARTISSCSAISRPTTTISAAWASVLGITAAIGDIAHHRQRRANGRQYPLRPPRHRRIHRPGGSPRHDARIRADHASRRRNLRPPARLGRIQRLRRRSERIRAESGVTEK